MIGNWIGPYKIVRELPQDRVGRVYEAVDAAGKKRFLIKSLRPEAASEPELISRLYSEAHTLALLNHEHIARLFGFIRRNDGLYLVMEFVQGENLDETLRSKGKLEPAAALAFFRQILSAVDFAHRLGVIHGDLKPANVIVTDFARIKVLDFAIGAIVGSSNPVDRVCSASYMSPEQIEGAAVDVRSDIYSLGVLLYELVIGKAPFAPAVEPKARSQSTPLLPSLIVRDIPNWLDAFLLRALAVSPDDRFPSVAAMSQAMGAAVATHTISAARKPGSLRALHGLHEVPLRPTNLRKHADQGRRSSKAVLTNSTKSERRPQFFARVWHIAVITNAAPWAKRQITGALAWTHQIAAAIEELPSVACARVRILPKKIADHADLRRRSSRGGASNPILVNRNEAINRSGPRPSFEQLKLTGDCRQWIKKTANALLESGWKRYVVLAFLLFSVFVEAFVFQGTNTLFRPDLDPSSILGASRNGAAQALLSDTFPAAATTGVREQSGPEAKVVKRSPKARRPAEEMPNRPIDDVHHQALDSKRTVVYRIPRVGSETDRTRLHDYRGNGQAERNLETSVAQTQLNVRWEN